MQYQQFATEVISFDLMLAWFCSARLFPFGKTEHYFIFFYFEGKLFEFIKDITRTVDRRGITDVLAKWSTCASSVGLPFQNIV